MGQATALIGQEIEALKQLRLERARTGLLNFTAFTKPDYQVNWHHRVIASFLNKVASGKINRLIINMPPRAGKALAIDTPIATPNGWKAMGDLRVGDYVFDSDGYPTKVIATSPHQQNRTVYPVWAEPGDIIYADAEHEWVGRACRKRPVIRKWTTQQLFDRQENGVRALGAPRQGALKLTHKSLPIPPYTLGLWLGDGCSGHATITAADEDAQFYRQEMLREGVETVDRKTKQSFGILSNFWRAIRALKMDRNKYIPGIYLRASAFQRLSLLQGLIDTDGSVCPKQGLIEFCNTNLAIARGVHELALSLGCRASITRGKSFLRGVQCQDRYRVIFRHRGACRLPRKSERAQKLGKDLQWRFLKVGSPSKATTCCIQVEAKNALFLAGTAMIPTHNSELVSRRFPAYYLGKNPNHQIVAASYSVTLAQRMNRDVQRIIDTPAYREIFPNVGLNNSNVRSTAQGSWLRNSDEFEVVAHRGLYRSAGVGSATTGYGAHLALIDDPVKNRDDSNSETIREKVWDWYTSTLYTRLEKGGAIVLVMTRWSDDDLAARLLNRARKNKDADQWTVLSLPAIHEGEHNEYDPREKGEPLWPEKYSLKRLKAMRETMGERDWVSLYQQRPAPASGNIIKNTWWRYWTELPGRIDMMAASADLSFNNATGREDFTVITVWARSGVDFYLVDMVRDRMGWLQQKKALDRVVANYPDLNAIYIENAALGAALVAEARQAFPGVVAVTPKGSKATRLEAVSGLIEGGNVFLPDPNTTGLKLAEQVISECAVFPNGANDDIVDSLSQGLAQMRSNMAQFTFSDAHVDKPSVLTGLYDVGPGQ